jgi:putative salt-induced outer membrane protein
LNRYFYLSLLSSTLLFAEDITEENIKTHAEVSYMKTTGNSKTETFSLKSEISAVLSEKSEVKGKVDALYATDDLENAIANKKYLEGEYNYIFSKNFYALVKSNYTDDAFSGYDYQLNIGPDLGYKVPFETKKYSLETSLSIQYSQNDPVDDDVDSYSSTEINAKYAWQIREKLKFKQSLSHLVSNDDTEMYFSKSVSAVE